MAKIVSIDLDPELVADYERAAGERGRSLEVVLTELVDPLDLIDAGRELALEARHALYACLHLALAVRRDTVVLTHDKGFAAAARRLELGDHLELLA